MGFNAVFLIPGLVLSIGRSFIILVSIDANEVSNCALLNSTPNSVMEFMI